MEMDGVLYPVEIKSKSRPATKDASGIAAFRRTYPHLRIGPGLVVAPAESFYPVTDLDFVMPWDARA